MLISQSAVVYLEAAWRQFRGASSGAVEHADDREAARWGEEGHPLADAEWWTRPWDGVSTLLTAMPESVGPSAPEAVATGPESDLERPSAVERRARAAAFRALLLARQRRHGEAVAAFAEALGLDPAIDLTETATFWDLDRTAHLNAADAYEAVGRTRDAMRLRARVELRFRPRLVRQT